MKITISDHPHNSYKAYKNADTVPWTKRGGGRVHRMIKYPLSTNISLWIIAIIINIQDLITTCIFRTLSNMYKRFRCHYSLLMSTFYCYKLIAINTTLGMNWCIRWRHVILSLFDYIEKNWIYQLHLLLFMSNNDSLYFKLQRL